MPMTAELKSQLEAAVTEVAELVQDEQEFAAIEKAKAVCDTLEQVGGPEADEIQAKLIAVADGLIQAPEAMTESLRQDLEFSLIEIAKLVEEEQEFEAIEKAKAVCDTLRTLRQGPEVEEIRARLVEVADFLIEDHRLAA